MNASERHQFYWNERRKGNDIGDGACDAPRRLGWAGEDFRKEGAPEQNAEGRRQEQVRGGTGWKTPLCTPRLQAPSAGRLLSSLCSRAGWLLPPSDCVGGGTEGQPGEIVPSTPGLMELEGGQVSRPRPDSAGHSPEKSQGLPQQRSPGLWNRTGREGHTSSQECAPRPCRELRSHLRDTPPSLPAPPFCPASCARCGQVYKAHAHTSTKNSASSSCCPGRTAGTAKCCWWPWWPTALRWDGSMARWARRCLERGCCFSPGGCLCPVSLLNPLLRWLLLLPLLCGRLRIDLFQFSEGLRGWPKAQQIRRIQARV